MKQLLFLISIVLIFSGCSKDDELPRDINEQPELYVKLTAGDRPLNLKAGVNGYFMTTYYKQGEDSGSAVGYMAGIIENRDQPQGSAKLEFRFRNPSYGAIQENDVWSTLKIGDVPKYYGFPVHLYRTIFSVPVNANITTYEWNFGDGIKGTGQVQTHDYSADFESYQVCLTTQTDSGCTDQVCSDVFMPNARCSAEIEVVQENSARTKFTYKSHVTGDEPIQYTWLLNNNVEGNSAEIKYEYPSNAFRVEHLRLHTEDANGCIADVAMKLDVGNSGFSCYSNFTYSVSEVEDIDPGFKTVEVIYTDPNGVVYNSALGGDKIGGFNFTIKEITNYISNNSSQPTAAMEVEFSGLVYNETGKSISLKNGKGRIAVAHP